VNDVKPPELTGTLTFQLGVLGSALAGRFAERIGALGLKAKHAGLLAALAASGGLSQQELAALMRVAPSLVVALADHLEALGALTRVRDPGDRRRQHLTLTGTGRELLAACGREAAEIEASLVAGLPEPHRAAFRTTLSTLLTAEGLPH
jgi:DNA-binding MarR family transcriptional regulator